MRAEQIDFELTDDEYERILDEIFGDVQICGMTYSSGRALRELDPTAFDIGKGDEEADSEAHPPKWKCGECGEEFDTEDEAEDCCKETCDSCGGLFMPSELIGMEHLCSDCEAETNELIEAEEDKEND